MVAACIVMLLIANLEGADPNNIEKRGQAGQILEAEPLDCDERRKC